MLVGRIRTCGPASTGGALLASDKPTALLLRVPGGTSCREYSLLTDENFLESDDNSFVRYLEPLLTKVKDGKRVTIIHHGCFNKERIDDARDLVYSAIGELFTAKGTDIYVSGYNIKGSSYCDGLTSDEMTYTNRLGPSVARKLPVANMEEARIYFDNLVRNWPTGRVSQNADEYSYLLNNTEQKIDYVHKVFRVHFVPQGVSWFNFFSPCEGILQIILPVQVNDHGNILDLYTRADLSSAMFSMLTYIRRTRRKDKCFFPWEARDPVTYLLRECIYNQENAAVLFLLSLSQTDAAKDVLMVMRETVSDADSEEALQSRVVNCT